MKVLVIGGTSFIGRQLVKELCGAGHDVAVMHRQAAHALPRRVENLMADRNDAESVQQALDERRFDVVYDNVYDWKRGTTAAQVQATVRACGDRVSRYIFMSSVAAYGDGLNHYEGDALAPDNHPEPYVRNKAMTERMLFRLHQRHGLPVVTFRPPFIYGPGNPMYREAFFWDRMRLGRPIIIPGDGHRLMQFVYVKDLVRAMIRAMEVPNAEGEAFNIGDSRALTQAEVVQALAVAAGKASQLMRIPREAIAHLGGNPMGDPAYFGVYFDVPPITEKMGKAARVLGVRPTPFDEGLKETWRWYLRHRNGRFPQPNFAFENRLVALVRAKAAGQG
jgi:nucleoside-diphosphate-sugar epimerase